MPSDRAGSPVGSARTMEGWLHRMSSDYRQPCASLRVSLLALAAFAAAGCQGDTGPQGPVGPPGPGGPTNTELQRGDTPPGLRVTIVSVTGGTGANGAFRVGDRVTVNYTLKKDD